MARHVQSHLEMSILTKGEFGWPGSGMATIEIIQNERLNDFLKLEFTPRNVEQPLQGTELQEKEAQKD